MHASVQDDATNATELRGFSVPAFAKRLGVSRSKGWDLVRKGQVKTLRVGTRRVVPSSELARVLNEAT